MSDESNIVQQSLNLHEIVDPTLRIEQEINTVITMWSFLREHPISQKRDIISCTTRSLKHLHKNLVQSAFSDEPKLLMHVNLLREKHHPTTRGPELPCFGALAEITSWLVWSANRYKTL